MKNILTSSSLKIALLITVVITIAFYWYQIRPTKIRHDCSWVKKQTNVIPFHPALSKKELEDKGMIKDCGSSPAPVTPSSSISFEFLLQVRRGAVYYQSCVEDNNKIIRKYIKKQEEIPTKDYWIGATQEQYKFCLHDKGL